MSTNANQPGTPETQSAATWAELGSPGADTTGHGVATDEMSPVIQLLLLAVLMGGFWVFCELACEWASHVHRPSSSQIVHGLGMPLPPLFR